MFTAAGQSELQAGCDETVENSSLSFRPPPLGKHHLAVSRGVCALYPVFPLQKDVWAASCVCLCVLGGSQLTQGQTCGHFTGVTGTVQTGLLPQTLEFLRCVGREGNDQHHYRQQVINIFSPYQSHFIGQEILWFSAAHGEEKIESSDLLVSRG